MLFTVLMQNNKENRDVSKIMLNISAIVQILLNISGNAFSTKITE